MGKATDVLIIGVGNPMRGDDAAGPLVAGLLAARGFETLVLDADGTHLIDAFAGREAVTIVDATQAGGEPGRIRRFEGDRMPLQSGLFHYSSHAFGVAEAIETARALDMLPRRLVVYGIEAADFTAGATPSAAVAAAVDAVAERIAKETRAG